MWAAASRLGKELIVNTPQSFQGLTGVEVRTGMEAVALDAAGTDRHLCRRSACGL